MLPGLGSVAVGGTAIVAVLVKVPVAEFNTFAVTVNVALPPFNKLTVVLIFPDPLATAQLEPLVATQVQVALVRFAGILSTTVAPVIALGPEFEATIV